MSRPHPLIFTSKQAPNVYLIGTTHTMCNIDIIRFLNTIKVDIVMFEDHHPFVSLADEMKKKIAETYYLKSIVEKNNYVRKTYFDTATKICKKNFHINNDSDFNIAIMKDSHQMLTELNKLLPIKLLTCVYTIKNAISRENEINSHEMDLRMNGLLSSFDKLQNISADLYLKGEYDKMFISQLITVTDNPFYKFNWNGLNIENKLWADNCGKIIFPENKGKTIVIFIGCVHLNPLVETSFLNYLKCDYGLSFTCESVKNIFPSNVIDKFIRLKTEANNLFKEKKLDNALEKYETIFENYRSYSLHGDIKMRTEYLNVLGNIITIYFQKKFKSKLDYYVNLTLKLIAYFNINIKDTNPNLSIKLEKAKVV